MADDDLQQYRTMALVRIDELADEDRMLRQRLRWAHTAGWPLFFFSIVGPIVGGSVALTQMVGAHRDLIIAVASLGASIAAALHKGLDCDAYQSGLRRALQILRGLSEAYETVAIMPRDVAVKRFEAAESRLADFRASSTDLPPTRRRAFRDIWTNSLLGKGSTP